MKNIPRYLLASFGVTFFALFGVAAYAVAPLVALSFTASTGASVASTATATVIGLALSALAFFSASTNNSIDYYIQPSINASSQLREAPPLDSWNPATDKPTGSTCVRSRYYYTTDTTPSRNVIGEMELQHLASVPCTNTYPKRFGCQLISGSFYSCEMNFVSTRLADQSFRFNVDEQFQSVIRATKASAQSSDDSQDSQMEFVRDTATGQFAQPFDPDYIQGTTEPSRPVWNNGKIYSSSLTVDNKQSTTVISARPDGGTDITTHIQDEPGLIRSFNTQISPSSVVQSASNSYSAGSVQPTSAIQPGAEFVPVTSSVNPTPTPNPGTGGTVQFPADYAKTGEASFAASQVVDGLLLGDVTIPSESTDTMPWFGSTFDGLAPSLAVSSVCPVVSFGQTRYGSFDSSAFCQMLQPQQGFLFAIFTAVWTLLGFRVVMSA